MLKDPNTNVVPTVYSYTLAAKVKKIWTFQPYKKEDF
jgi:hypothetical protein